jgi:hypothetical protein
VGVVRSITYYIPAVQLLSVGRFFSSWEPIMDGVVMQHTLKAPCECQPASSAL